MPTMQTAPPLAPTSPGHNESEAEKFPLDPNVAQQLKSLERRQRVLGSLSVPLRTLFGARLRAAFGIITYHRVAQEVANDAGLLNVTPSRFREQIGGLLKLGYEAWPLRTLLRYQREAKQIPRNAFAVVFDDGYENNYRNAFPILREFNVPATIFVATAYLDSQRPFPFDDWTSQQEGQLPTDCWRPLSTDQCQEMLTSGLIDIGCHTHTHQDFRGRPVEFGADLDASLGVLRDRFGLQDATFSFPYGFLSDSLISEVKQRPLLCCLSAECQTASGQQDPFTWGRFGATEIDSPRTLAAKLDGWNCWVRACFRRLRGRN